VHDPMLASQGNGGRAPTLGSFGDSAPRSSSEQSPQEKAHPPGNWLNCREEKQGGGPTGEETFAPTATPVVTIILASGKRGRGAYCPALRKEGG